MEFRHLRYFVAVAEELNFTRAAEKLHLAQPSLTRQIHNLEDELGVRLLDRTKNHVSLTEEGQRFLVDARRLMALSQESVRAVQRFSHGECGQLNLGYLFKFNCDLLPTTLTKFYQSCPDCTVNLLDMCPSEQLRALEERKIDMGFVGLRPDGAGKDPDLTWELVARHSVVVVLPAHHPLAKKNKIKVTELKSLFFVAMSEQSHPGSHEWLTGICQQAGFTPRILQDVEFESGIINFVAEDLGVTLAREQIKKLPHPGVVFRPLTTDVVADYWIAWSSNNRATALRRYLEVVRKEVTARAQAPVTNSCKTDHVFPFPSAESPSISMSVQFENESSGTRIESKSASSASAGGITLLGQR